MKIVAYINPDEYVLAQTRPASSAGRCIIFYDKGHLDGYYVRVLAGYCGGMMIIETFEDLLLSAHQQQDAQRLLFVFTCSELPEDCTDEQRARFEIGMGGALKPVMVVDKLPEDIQTFSQLVEESTQFAQDNEARSWALVFVAALGGRGRQPPSGQDADAPLQRMVANIRSGNIRSFLTFDRQGEMVRLM